MTSRPQDTDLNARLTTWLRGSARRTQDLSHLCGALLQTLNDAGLQIDRLNLGVFLHHPELAGVAYQITPEMSETTAIRVTHEALASPTYRNSPICLAVETRQATRYPLQPSPTANFPILHELHAGDFTDYAVFPMEGTQGRIHVLSLATQAREGLPSGVYAVLREFCYSFGLLVDALTVRELSEVLLRLYVGNMTGPRVLRGEVQLGRGQSIDAAILYSDMRGFSSLCNRAGPTATIDVLNQYFSIVSRCVHRHSGEIIKLMGDAILAVFPVAGDTEQASIASAQRCLDTATMARALLSTESPPEESDRLRAGFGLTLGEVIYGNIGAPGRLDFTIIGDAVNLAARLESLGKSLNHDILIGPNLAQVTADRVSSLGHRTIRGLDHPQEVFAPTSDMQT